MQNGSLDVSGLKEEADCGEEVGDKWEPGLGFFFMFSPRAYGCCGLQEVEARLCA